MTSYIKLNNLAEIIYKCPYANSIDISKNSDYIILDCSYQISPEVINHHSHIKTSIPHICALCESTSYVRNNIKESCFINSHICFKYKLLEGNKENDN